MAITSISVKLLFLCTCLLTYGQVTSDRTDSNAEIHDPINLVSFPYYTSLDPNYELRWNFNSTHIVFQTHVKTTGYIGFGISKNGGMYPSDLIIAGVKDNKVFFSDRHATGFFLPPKDDHQDWFLLHGEENEGYMTITFIRKLNTCDDDDIKIGEGITKIIFSYSDKDPASHDLIHYHGKNRGTKSIYLLDPPSMTNEIIDLPNDTYTIDILKNNYSVPSSDTTYGCNIIKFPALDGKHHIIRYEPVIQEGHEKLVHHMILYYCSHPQPVGNLDVDFECYTRNNYERFGGDCNNNFIAWAIGGKPFDFPAHVGQPLGGVGDPTYFKLEIHYDNVLMKNDFIDNSGLRIHLTKQLRKHDSGILAVGKQVNKFQIIPPHSPRFLSRGYCTEDCIASALGNKKINIFADMLHAHLLGTDIRTRHLRNGTELEPILKNYNYDFNFQDTRLLKKERVVKKGDVIFTDCYYDSTNRSTITFGGLSTRQEMCLSFLMYYPRIEMNNCLSMSYPGPDESKFFAIIKNMDFTQKSHRDLLAGALGKSAISLYCNAPNINHHRRSLKSQPVINNEYIEKDVCTDSISD